MNQRRKSALAAVGAGTLALAAGLAGVTATLTAGSAHASAAPGSDFLSLGLIAESGGERIIGTQQATGEPDGSAEGDIPFAQANLSTNGGHALCSLAWPGSLLGDLGSLIVLSGGPPQATALNDPVRAEAPTSTGGTSQKMAVPGGTMTATAQTDASQADAQIGGTRNATVGTAGTTHVTSVARITGPHTAYADATSLTENATFGVVSIGSVSSHARVDTNGTAATGSGRTVVSDMKVAGIPVTVDDKGVHANGQGTALNPATDVVNQRLAATTTQVFLTKPTKTTAANGVTYDAGSLIISFDNGGFIVELGGAKAIAGSTRGTPYRAPPPPKSPSQHVKKPAPTTPGVTGGAGSTGSSGGVPISSGSAPSGGPGPSAPAPVTASSPRTLAAFTLPSGALSPAWPLLALVGAGLVAAGLRRLPDRVLEATASPCPLGDDR